ncbi:NAD(P)-dependent oxidoreductase [Pseudorhodoplanes sp.]|uniref:NAD(P)-dependent oxidoreductase n=1 Tax=Pseudorhodoplanes sp. TaxID=1934341 RepID=UPI002B698282|nr:NAD(P)-dependent oxidoreductase [Pseudorhodoplanes sp.]HWV43210.1 NAD(P)-dependent oxidoreductase [Pseudorhodoplanes sp.]
MQTIGFIGVGKIGLPICEHLIRKGYRVLGYRRSSLAEFEALGGIRAKSPADIGAQADIVFTCLPNDDALEEVINGPDGLKKTARPGQIIVEFGSHPVPVKQQYVAPLAEKGAVFLDGEVSGTPGMVQARKAVIYLGGPAEAVKKLEPIVADFADLCLHLGDFGAATKVKLVNNFLVALHIAGTAQAMALGLKTGVDKDMLIKAVATGSGGSSAFAIRAPLMAERRFMPQMGSAAGLAHYLDTAKDMAKDAGVATDLLDSLIDLFARAVPNIGDRDVAAMLEYFETTRRN